ncbi:hypothetical protein, partial [Mycobacterium seoulense]|uniref:hypothetical protein n=1 Tax=Mycobacterium seoulense TaxID=386911 RepID=UPI0021F25832
MTVLSVILAAGTSPAGLMEMIKLPLRFASVFSIPLFLPRWTYLLDLLAVVGALGYGYVAGNREAGPGRVWRW